VNELTIGQFVSLGLAAVACGWDLRTRRIPQVLTLGGALAAVVFHSVNGGSNAGVASAAGWFVGIAIFFLPFALGGLGAGDVKLLGAIGAWLGPMNAIWVGLYAGAAGGILAIFVALTKGYLIQAVGNVGVMLAYWRLHGIKPLPEITLEHSRGPRLAYAVPIFAGTVATLWLK
jgi:prepilin peptidase CpaA